METKVTGYAYNAEYYDSATGVINLRARQYEVTLCRFNQKDFIHEQANTYLYCANSPISYIDINGLEMIVFSGGAYEERQEGDPTDYNFIEPAINELRDLSTKNPNESLTWMIMNAGWNEDDKNYFIRAAKDINSDISVLFIDTTTQCEAYVNNKNTNSRVESPSVSKERQDDQISYLSIFSHGNMDENETTSWFAPDLHFGSNQIGKDQISRWNSQAFSNATINSYACRTGTNLSDSLAQFMSDHLLATVYAYSRRSDYENIVLPNENLLTKALRKIGIESAEYKMQHT